MEERYRQELDKLRSEQATAIGELEANHIISSSINKSDISQVFCPADIPGILKTILILDNAIFTIQALTPLM